MPDSFRAFFNSLTPISSQSWDHISRIFKAQVLKKGDLFIREGQMERRIAYLGNGIIRAFFKTIDGIEYNKHFFVNPCFIGGYASLITKKPSLINQQALSNCELLVANYADLEALYPVCPDIERAARILAERFFVQKEQREIELVLTDADKRYLNFQKEFPQLEQEIAQYHIASYLGITPTQLSRIRRKLSDR